MEWSCSRNSAKQMEDAKDINAVKIEIEALLAKEISPWTTDCCIYRVPNALRKLNEDVFTPGVVSIGPFHYGNPKLQSMEKHKQVYFQKFIRRSGINSNTLVDKVEELEQQIRRSYSEDIIKPEKKELIKLIVVDACFILELFLMFSHGEFTENDSPLLRSCFPSHIGLDLILLENQLPFFVLEELFNLAFFSPRGSQPSLLELTFHFFSDYNKLQLSHHNVIIKNFTDLLRIFHLHPSSRRSDKKSRQPSEKLKFSATKLHEAGVKLMKDETKCSLHLKFSRPHLRIPELVVDDSTEILFRNLMALEQCHYLRDSYITDYICMMDYLINNSKDVDILVQKEIICNWLGDNYAVAKLFNSLATNVQAEHTDDNDIFIELNKFCEDSCNMMKATLRRDYCGTPWQTVASLGGILLLILTLIQTVCSIVQAV